MGSYKTIFYTQTCYGTGLQNQNILLHSKMKGEQTVWNMKQARALKRFPKSNFFRNETVSIEALNTEYLLSGLSLRFRDTFVSESKKVMGLSMFPIYSCLECEEKKKKKKIIFDSLK